VQSAAHHSGIGGSASLGEDPIEVTLLAGRGGSVAPVAEQPRSWEIAVGPTGPLVSDCWPIELNHRSPHCCCSGRPGGPVQGRHDS